ncbi:NB-ARC domain-containing protein [Streptomonospora wellingtoniae]|uniref:NB-ARC domain-containing protein n=1 Tax=Streptomonospora wellingtoniae TaxID=3075544 RepID=A0ABU2KT11_9ACTN|nr:NB-ARC domain-containing protein [Streptomonospora sp. DSM 45055]MDT0302436.1 NB-ARC domain-containing protein [Streptomonospora sp. DSM 45055]
MRRLTGGVVAPIAFISCALLLQMAPDLLDDFPRTVVWGLSITGAVATAAVTVGFDPNRGAGTEPPPLAPKQPQIELPPYSERFTGHAGLMGRLRRRFRIFPRRGVRGFLDVRAKLRGDSRRSPLVVVISGAPGTGKTQVATQMAHEVLDRFPDGVRWVELSGDREPDEADSDPDNDEASGGGLTRGIGRRMRRMFDRGARRDSDTLTIDVPGPTLPQREPRSTAKVLEALVQSMQGRIPSGAAVEELSNTWRALTYSRRMLVVLDNAKDADQVWPLVPSGSRCAVLITSRRAFGHADFEFESYELDELGQREGEELLDRIAPVRLRSGSNELDRVRRDRAEIVRRCHGLPLALRLCGGRLVEQSDPSPREVLEELDDFVRSPLLDGPHGFAASFAFSLRLCEPRERLLLKHIADSDLRKFSDWSAAVLLDVPRDTAGALIDGLVRRYLVLATERNETRENTFRIHDLVRETLRTIDAREFGLTLWERENWEGADDRAAARRLVRAYTWLVEQAAAEVTRTHDPGVLGERTDLTPAPELRLAPTGSPRQWFTQERESLLMCMRLAETHDLPEEGWRLAHAFAALCQVWRVYWADWEQATLVQLRTAYRLGDRLAGGLARLDRAEIAGKTGDYQTGIDDAETARRVFEQAGDLGAARSGEAADAASPHWRARAWRSLGVNLQRRGHLDGGAEALDTAERIFGGEGDHWWRARVLCDLAEVHAQRGRRRDAEYRSGSAADGAEHLRAQELLQSACRIFRDEQDWDEHSNARIALAEILAARGRHLNAWFMLDEVREYYRRAEERWYTARCQRAMSELDTVRLDEQWREVRLALDPARAEYKRDRIEGKVAREGRRFRLATTQEHLRIYRHYENELRDTARGILGEYFDRQEEWFDRLPRSGRAGRRAVADKQRRWSVEQRIRMLEEAAATLAEMGDTWGRHRTDLALGGVRLTAKLGVDECAATMRAAAEGFAELGDQLWHARAHRTAAEALADAGWVRYALVDAEYAYEAFQRLGDRVGRIGAEELFGRLLDETGNTPAAIRRLTAAREEARAVGLEWSEREAHRRLTRIQNGRTAPPERFRWGVGAGQAQPGGAEPAGGAGPEEPEESADGPAAHGSGGSADEGAPPASAEPAAAGADAPGTGGSDASPQAETVPPAAQGPEGGPEEPVGALHGPHRRPPASAAEAPDAADPCADSSADTASGADNESGPNGPPRSP